MGSNELIFELIRESKCPFYKTGDEFRLSGNALLLKIEGEHSFISTAIVRLPGSKQCCPILIGDLTRLLIQYENIDKIPLAKMACGGCGGTVRLQPKRQTVVQPASTQETQLKDIEIAAGMIGKLSELPALELLQALNLSQKTGVLTLTLSAGSAILCLRDGNLISATYKNLEGRQAICEALKEREGRFKFDPNLPADRKNTPIMGPMMEILLDTSRMLDEQTQK